MAGVTGTIGDGAGGSASRLDWRPRPGLLIPPALVQGGGVAYFMGFDGNTYSGGGRHFADLNLTTALTAGALNPGTAGPRLTPKWESYEEALTISAGGRQIAIPGPNHPSNQSRDTSEPYFWNLGPTAATAWRTFSAFYRGLTPAQRAATQIELRDGPAGATVVIDTAPQTVDSQGTVNLAATVTPLPGSTVVSHAWTATGGAFANPAIEDAVWVAPWRPLGSGETPYTLTLTVTDSAGRVTSGEVVITVREVSEIDLAIGDSGPVAGIAVAGSGPLRGMAVGPVVVYRKRGQRNTLVSRNTDITRITEASSRNTVIGTRSTSYGGSSYYTSAGSRSTQAPSRTTSAGTRNTSSTHSTSAGSRNTSSSRTTSTGGRFTSGTRITGSDKHAASHPTNYNRVTAGFRSTSSSRSTSLGTRSTSTTRSTTSFRSTSSGGSRLTSTGTRLTGTGGGSRSTNIIRSTEATTRATVIGTRNTSFTRITEI